MKINDLISTIKTKIINKITCEKINIEDKTYLHLKHKNFDKKKYHIKIIIKSNQLKEISKIDANKLIYSLITDELNKEIHSLQILIN
tara:strand:- start:15140 stop:15400 length:261 start_codon:yes stop_codon:yes gene_type:complete